MRWLAEHAPEGALAFRVGRDGDDLVAEWTGLVTLRAHRDGTNVRFAIEPDAPPRDVDKIVRGSAALLLRHLAGKLALHGASVARGDRAVVLLGRSGAGKSTLAAALAAHGDVALYSDDAVAIDGPSESASAHTVVAMETNHWLEPDARRELGIAADSATKEPVPAARTGALGASLVAIVELGWGDEVALTRAPPMQALAALVPQIARFVIDEPSAQRAELDAALALVAAVPTYRLVRPRRFDLLGESVARVLSLIDPARAGSPRTR